MYHIQKEGSGAKAFNNKFFELKTTAFCDFFFGSWCITGKNQAFSQPRPYTPI